MTPAPLVYVHRLCLARAKQSLGPHRADLQFVTCDPRLRRRLNFEIKNGGLL